MNDLLTSNTKKLMKCSGLMVNLGVCGKFLQRGVESMPTYKPKDITTIVDTNKDHIFMIV